MVKRPSPLKRSKEPHRLAVEWRGKGVPGPGSAATPLAEADQETGQAEPAIFIEIDPLVPGGHLANRFDLTIRGRAISATPIEQIRLQAGDWVTSASAYGLPDRAPVCDMPDGTQGQQRAFRFNLPRPGGGESARFAFQIIARTEDGFEHAEDFEVQVDPSSAVAASVVSGPTGAAASFAPPYALLFIERGTIDAQGTLTVQGWAVSFNPIQAIRVQVDDAFVSEAITGLERQDVGAIFAAYPNALLSGFGLTMPLDEALRDVATVRVRMVCLNGFGHEESIPLQRGSATTVFPTPERFALVDRPPSYLLVEHDQTEPHARLGLELSPETAAAFRAQQQRLVARIEMFCDAAVLTGDGMLSLDGWAICATGIAQVRVQLDGRDVGLATYGHERLDVAGFHPDIRMAHLSGFRFDQRVGDRFEGEHDVRVVVSGAQGGEAEQQVLAVATPLVLPEKHDASIPKVTPEQAEEFRFELDAPILSNGEMLEPVTGRMTVEGWLLTRSGVAEFRVYLDDQLLGDAHCGLARQDVGAAFPDWPNAIRSGFAFYCPPRSLRDGKHTVRLAIRANNGVEMDRSFELAVRKSDDNEDALGIRRRVPRVETDMMLALLAGMDPRPAFRFIVRQGGAVDTDAWETTLDALRRQAYGNWTAVVLVEDDDAAAAVRGIIADRIPRLADRFSVASPSAGTWDMPLVQDGPSTLHALLSPGDEPGADALLELAVAYCRHPDSDLLYGDEVRISPVSNQKEPFFKPDFSPDLLTSTNYIGRLWVATTGLLAKVGVTAAGLATAGEYDLLLRCVEQAGGVHHVPKLLCQRGTADLDSPVLEQAALRRMLDRRGLSATVLSTAIPGTWRIKRAVPSKGKVSIIIPTCAASGYIETCISTLRAKTTYPEYEIICVDNIPTAKLAWKIWLQEAADQVVDMPDAFNWSTFNNRAAEIAVGEYLLFLNDDIEIIQDDWLDALVEHAQRPDVGIVGPQLLYRDGTVQHAGMFLAGNGIGRHAFRYAAADDPCYFGLALTQRNVMAVTGACMLVRRETFERLGRFDEAHQIVNNDLDFCLRAHRAGLLTVFTPYATLTHYELASRASMKDVYDLTHFDAAWKTTFAAGDPYFNPRLSAQADDYRPDDEPVQWVVSGTPKFTVAEIERILVVKLDHIGDFVTAMPPIRRLRKLFPSARISVLASPASGGFVALEPCIDEFIPFSFFHQRSQLGERTLTREDYAALSAKLLPYRFDLAVDLRKHPSTRDVLQCTGARFLAGYDYLGQFPFLDVALDWDGDRRLQRKRNHIIDDLVLLVDAIGHATENDRLLMQPGPAAMPLTELPDDVGGLFAKPVVALHPGAGNITKEWPEEHFSALIDLLIERNDVNIMLVGGPDDVEVADRLMNVVIHKGSVASMAGRTSLADLPRLLKNCALYIGNDSGPKHVAAAVGIPTIGIHSGVVDPTEWGPIGPRAVALRRNMTCSPCYLANAEDCPRSLACLKFFEPAMVYETAVMMLDPSVPAVGPMESGEPVAGAAARKARAKRQQPVTEPV
jgi:ADP-heptose:LPS heptosyltransferase/GT2 family glycosyltransferase